MLGFEDGAAERQFCWGNAAGGEEEAGVVAQVTPGSSPRAFYFPCVTSSVMPATLIKRLASATTCPGRLIASFEAG